MALVKAESSLFLCLVSLLRALLRPWLMVLSSFHWLRVVIEAIARARILHGKFCLWVRLSFWLRSLATQCTPVPAPYLSPPSQQFSLLLDFSSSPSLSQRSHHLLRTHQRCHLAVSLHRGFYRFQTSIEK